ncbi:MAG: cytidine deaminase [Pseudobdellovibrio sp.]
MHSSAKSNEQIISELKGLAVNAMNFSHSPYSEKKIGAALQLNTGSIYTGCNIENASYGGTVCAERVAIFKAFSENKKPVYITHIAVASNEVSPWPPCGFCRQVLAEFAQADTLVTLTNTQGKEKTLKFSELFPFAFEPEHLGK